LFLSWVGDICCLGILYGAIILMTSDLLLCTNVCCASLMDYLVVVKLAYTMVPHVQLSMPTFFSITQKAEY